MVLVLLSQPLLTLSHNVKVLPMRSMRAQQTVLIVAPVVYVLLPPLVAQHSQHYPRRPKTLVFAVLVST